MIAPQIPMQFATLFIAALLALPAAGLFTWAWVAMARSTRICGPSPASKACTSTSDGVRHALPKQR